MTNTPKGCILYTMKIDYAFSEDKVIRDLKEYVDGTYDKHYAKRRYQATQFIEDCGHGEGFCMGNILKYAQRYGRKGGKNRADLMKILLYGIIMLHLHDTLEKSNEKQTNTKTKK